MRFSRTLIALIALVIAIGMFFYPEINSQEYGQIRQDRALYEQIDSAYYLAVSSVDAQMLSSRLGTLLEALDDYDNDKVNTVEYENLSSLRRQAEELGSAGVASDEFQAVLEQIPWNLAKKPTDLDFLVFLFRFIGLILGILGIFYLKMQISALFKSEHHFQKRKNGLQQKLKTSDGEELMVVEESQVEMLKR